MRLALQVEGLHRVIGELDNVQRTTGGTLPSADGGHHLASGDSHVNDGGAVQ